MRYALCTLICFLAIGCQSSESPPTSPDVESRLASTEDLNRRLIEIAAKYKGYRQVDDRMREAPAMCAAPNFFPTPSFQLSRSMDTSTHGKKLYRLYAAKLNPDSGTYTALDSLDQVIVKESWHTEVAGEDDDLLETIGDSKGARFKPGAKGPLFVMFRTDASHPLSDEGWIYGTLTPDGKTITGIGRIANCMACHEKARHGRLFGLPKD